jgi:hypothetical protein
MDGRANDGTLLTGPNLLVPGHLLAPFGWAALPLAALTQSRQHLLKDLFELDRPRIHVIGLALAYLDVDQVASRAAVLFTAPLRDAVHCILGRCPSGVQCVLSRLPSAVLSPEAYKNLIELLDDPRSARVLYHLDETELTDRTIRVLRELPAALTPTLTAIVNHVWLLDGLSAGLRRLAARTGAPSFDALVADLAAQRQPAQLIAHIRKLVDTLPVPDRLPPTSMDEPGSRVVCHVARHGRLGWALDDALGPGNVKPNSNDRQRITDAFGQVGIPEARLFEAIELIAQASVSKAERRLRRREREDLHEIAFM